MPVPGPRTQTAPVSGYRNPMGEHPDRINRWNRPGAVSHAGRTPGLMRAALRGCVLAAGTVRRIWRQSVDYTPASPPYSWVTSAPAPGRPGSEPVRGGVGITTALRYMARSTFIPSGVDSTRYVGLHTRIEMRNRSKPITTGAGQSRSRPTVRNRITSFGSRVPPLNPRIIAAEDVNE